MVRISVAATRAFWMVARSEAVELGAMLMYAQLLELNPTSRAGECSS